MPPGMAPVVQRQTSLVCFSLHAGVEVVDILLFNLRMELVAMQMAVLDQISEEA